MVEVEIPNAEELEEIRGKKFTRRVALVTAIFAVILAIASLGGSNATKEMLLAQQQSSDQWAFYQAKVIREHLYKSQQMMLDAGLAERGGTMKPDALKRYESLINKFGEEESRYRTEKKDIEKEAKKLEHERDISRNKDPYFDFAEVLLQISIVMASVSILAVSRQIFYFAVFIALMGAVLTINGYLLIFRIPFLH